MAFSTTKDRPYVNMFTDSPIMWTYVLLIRHLVYLCEARLALAPYSPRSIGFVRFLHMLFLHMMHCSVAGDTIWDVEDVDAAVDSFEAVGDEAG